MCATHIDNPNGMWRGGGGKGGVFAQRTAQLLLVSPKNIPCKPPPPTEVRMIHSNQHRGCGIQDPGTRGYRRWNTADVSHSARCASKGPSAQFCDVHKSSAGGGGGCKGVLYAGGQRNCRRRRAKRDQGSALHCHRARADGRASAWERVPQ